MEDWKSVLSDAERLRVIMDVAGIGDWSWDADRDAVHLSDRAAAILRLPDRPYTWTAFTEGLHPNDRARVNEIFARALEEGGDFAVDWRVVDGTSERWILGKARVFRDPARRVTGVQGVVQDVTDEWRTRQTLRDEAEILDRAREEAETANRLKDDFLATVSHELRTPLNAILGWARLLRSGKPGLDLTRGLETIERNARSQSQIIEDLLDMSRISSGKLSLDIQRVDLAATLANAVMAMRPAAVAKRIRISMRTGQGPVIVAGDPMRLDQIFGNLLTNAVKFTPEGGTVEVGIDEGGDRVHATVADSGEGISAEALPHIFDRFKQVDSSTTRVHGGLGLGLSIARHLVEMQGGSIGARSDGEGRGAVFTVTLPLLRAAVESPVGNPLGIQDLSPELERALAGISVLIVDDEPDARDLLQAVLTRAGADVALAASAEEALELIVSARFDVLVSDIVMPGADGHELLQTIRALEPPLQGVPAVALTAQAGRDQRRHALTSGFQAHLAKPVDASELLSVLAGLVRRGR